LHLTNKRALISHHEGRVPHAYHDSLGFLTIGVGHLIDRRKGGALPEHVINALLTYDIEKHETEMLHHLPWAKDLDPVRFAVLVDMAFNLGTQGLLGFKNTLAAVKENRWEDAEKGMLASKWATQVGGRARRLGTMMRTGEWPTV
jgi:lysozyme